MVFEYKSNKQGTVRILQLSGELIDKNQATAMLKEIETVIANGENKIVLNLHNLKYVNSSGLNIIINILTKVRAAGGDLAICCVNKKINDLLIITKLNTIFKMSDNEELAIATLK